MTTANYKMDTDMGMKVKQRSESAVSKNKDNSGLRFLFFFFFFLRMLILESYQSQVRQQDFVHKLKKSLNRLSIDWFGAIINFQIKIIA